MKPEIKWLPSSYFELVGELTKREILITKPMSQYWVYDYTDTTNDGWDSYGYVTIIKLMENDIETNIRLSYNCAIRLIEEDMMKEEQSLYQAQQIELGKIITSMFEEFNRMSNEQFRRRNNEERESFIRANNMA